MVGRINLKPQKSLEVLNLKPNDTDIWLIRFKTLPDNGPRMSTFNLVHYNGKTSFLAVLVRNSCFNRALHKGV